MHLSLVDARLVRIRVDSRIRVKASIAIQGLCLDITSRDADAPLLHTPLGRSGRVVFMAVGAESRRTLSGVTLEYIDKDDEALAGEPGVDEATSTVVSSRHLYRYLW